MPSCRRLKFVKSNNRNNRFNRNKSERLSFTCEDWVNALCDITYVSVLLAWWSITDGELWVQWLLVERLTVQSTVLVSRCVKWSKSILDKIKREKLHSFSQCRNLLNVSSCSPWAISRRFVDSRYPTTLNAKLIVIPNIMNEDSPWKICSKWSMISILDVAAEFMLSEFFSKDSTEAC